MECFGYYRVVKVQVYHSVCFEHGFAVDHEKSFPKMNFEYYIYIYYKSLGAFGCNPELMISFLDLILHTECLVGLLESQVTLRLAGLVAHLLPLQEAG